MYTAIVYVAVLVFSVVANAMIWRVPSEVSTIQSALDQIANQDTILVSSGQYDEALIAPPRSFTLLGQTAPDSASLTGTVIDIGYLPEAHLLRCLTLTEGTAVVESLLFRNSAGAYDTNRAGMGGILAGNSRLIVSNCLFDSLFGSIDDGDELIVTNSSFFHIQGNAIASGGAPIRARNCVFSGRGSWQVACGGRAEFIDCIFEQDDQGHFLVASGDSITIDGCIFRDYGPYAFVPVVVAAGRGCAIRNCVFSNIDIGRAAIEIELLCDSLEGSQLEISNVVFDGYEGGFGQGGTAMLIHCEWEQAYQGGYPVMLSNVEFRDGVVIDAQVIALRAEVPILADSCEFADLLPLTLPSCLLAPPVGADYSVVHQCAFDSDLIAIQAGDSVDARWCWWGDSSGPTEPIQNPSGIGAEIRGPVAFAPWLTVHPDSSDTNGVAIDDDQLILHPSSFVLSVFPNPFNATTTLQVDVARAGEYEVKLFDVTGREVVVLFDGRIESRAEVMVDGSGFASGVYFAVLRDQRSNLAVTKLLILK